MTTIINNYIEISKSNIFNGKCTLIYGKYNKTKYILETYKNIKILDARSLSDIKYLISNLNFENDNLSIEKGILVECMMNGTSLCIKNIDYNMKLLSFLKSVIKNNRVIVNGEQMIGHHNFRLILTSNLFIKNKYMNYIRMVDINIIQALEIIQDSSNFENEKFVIMLFKCVLDRNINDTIDKNTHIKLKRLLDADISNIDSFFHHFSLYFLSDLPIKERNIVEKKCKELLGYINEVKDTGIIYNHDFVLTQPVFYILHDLIRLIKMNVPVLIIGETGTGKTTLIQWLHKNMDTLFDYSTELKIINLSYDTDLSDLIGYFQNTMVETKENNQSKTNSNSIENFNDYLKNIEKNGHNKLHKQKFRYLNGIFTDAIINGHWLLLDEINLAQKELIDAVNSILNNKNIYLFEKGTNEAINIHPNFRIFACMNPPNDAGKKEIEANDFHRLYYEDFIKNIDDIKLIVKNHIDKFKEDKIEELTNNLNEVLGLDLTTTIANFYFEIVYLLNEKSISGFSLEPLITGRTLCRFLKSLNNIELSEAIEMFIYTQFNLDSTSRIKIVTNKYFKLKKIITKQNMNINKDAHKNKTNFFVLNNYNIPNINIIENAIKNNIPVLLQGPTSTGKTSSIYYLAEKYKKNLCRINNHEHTEASDYIGSYTMNSEGILVFQNGPLITAMQKGDWILLDELNLAPTEVLEVLNRLLDDNQEVYVNKTIIKANRSFRLFATQNISYGGRKQLSKAFRNRFVEINFLKPSTEQIRDFIHPLLLPKSFTNRMINVYESLHSLRSFENIMTLRDLFKWGKRKVSDLNDVFFWGLMLIYEKQRNQIDRQRVLDSFFKIFKMNIHHYKKIQNDYMGFTNENNYKSSPEFTMVNQKQVPNINNIQEIKIKTNPSNIISNSTSPASLIESNVQNREYKTKFLNSKSHLKLLYFIDQCIKHNEAVLVVGETGIGKTRVIEQVADLHNRTFITITMHQNIDTSDFIGHFEIPYAWKDGPLLKAMKNGSFLFIDEINLASDSVLERFNSLFEHKKEIFVSEINENIVAHPDFRIFACMNPGNDFGKRELSPALRNRFTEIFFEVEMEDKLKIIDQFINEFDISVQEKRDIYASFTENLDYIEKTSLRVLIDKLKVIKKIIDKQREVFYFCGDVNSFIKNEHEINESHTEGWDLIRSIDNKIIERSIITNTDPYFDMIGKNIHIRGNQERDDPEYNSIIGHLNRDSADNKFFSSRMENIQTSIGVFPYFFEPKCEPNRKHAISITTRKNLQKLLWALYINKPILIKGTPGTGKTTIIQYMSELMGKKLIRVNLSEETEMSDLCGTFIPKENGNISFYESELVKALRDSQWVLLDEINLASQSVLEGFNSALDYRRTLFLENNVKLGNDARILATMNATGLGRKILPRSFLDRFEIIEFEEYSKRDIDFIIKNEYKHNKNDVITFFDKKVVLKKLNSHTNKFETENQKNNISQENIPLLPKNKTPNHIQNNIIDSVNIKENSVLIDNQLDIPNNYFKENFTLRNALASVKLGAHNISNIQYECGENNFIFSTSKEIMDIQCIVEDKNYTIPHNYLTNLYLLIKCILYNIPVIIKGKLGKHAMLEFIGKILGLKVVSIGCSSETDLNDLLGQFTVENFRFCWKNSQLVQALQDLQTQIIVFDNPELVETSIFDRLNSLLESNRTLFIYEKGENPKININKEIRMVLCVDDLIGLSNAVIDRCWCIDFSDFKTDLDINKMFNRDIFTDVYIHLDSNQEMNIFDRKPVNFTENQENINHTNNNKKRFLPRVSDNSNTENFDYNIKTMSQRNKPEKENIKIRKVLNCLTSNNNQVIEKFKKYKNKFNEIEVEKLCVQYKPNILFPDIINVYKNNDILAMLNITDLTYNFNEFETEIYEANDFQRNVKFLQNIKYEIKIYDNDIDKVKYIMQQSNSELQILAFMKNRNISFMKTMPTSITHLMYLIIESSKDLSLYYFHDLFEIVKVIRESQHSCGNVLFDSDLYANILLKIFGIIGKAFDPLFYQLIKSKLEYNKKFLNIKSELENEFIKMYKYGKSKIESKVHSYINSFRFRNEIEDVQNLINSRNFVSSVELAKTKLYTISDSNEPNQSLLLDHILNDLSSNENFNDITNYNLFKKYDFCNSFIEQYSLKYLYIVLKNIKLKGSEQDISSLLNIIKQYNIEINSDFAHMFLDNVDITNEMISIDNKTYCFEFQHQKWLETWYFNTEIFIKEAYNCFFQEKFIYNPIINLKNIRVTVNSQMISFIEEDRVEFAIKSEILNNSILTRAELLIFDNTSVFSKYYERLQKNLNWLKDYSWYLVLYCVDHNMLNITNYLLNTKLHQFFDRLYFIDKFIESNKSSSNPDYNLILLYNLALQYKSFGLENTLKSQMKKYNKRIQFRPKQYREYEDFLMQETITLLEDIDINDVEISCNCNDHKNEEIYTYIGAIDNKNCKNNELLLEDDLMPRIEQHKNSLCFLNNFSFKKMQKINLNETIRDLFYTKTPTYKYTNDELLFAKLFNEFLSVSKNFDEDFINYFDLILQTHLKYDLCPVLLKKLYDYIQSFKKTEEVTGLEGLQEGKGGESKTLDEEEQHNDASDDMCDSENVEDVDDDALSLDNNGNIHDNDFDEEKDLEEIESIDNLDEKNTGISEENSDDQILNHEDNEQDEDCQNKEEITNDDQKEELVEDEDIEENEHDDISSISNDALNEEEMDISVSEESFEDHNDNVNDQEEIKNEETCMLYGQTENIKNENQTCDEGINYNSYVKGDNENMRATEAGEGDEVIEGNGEEQGDENIKFTEDEIINANEVYSTISADSYSLTNKLRVILDCNKNNRYLGNYKSGKKLNMKQIIPFIISDYQKNKIWLRRKKNDDRKYIVRVFIDGSKSMSDTLIIERTLTAFKKICFSLTYLNINFEIYKFGKDYVQYENIDDFARNIVFDHETTSLKWIDDFNDGVNLVLTDGIFQSSIPLNDNFLLIMIDRKGIRDLEKITFNEQGIIRNKYLDTVNLKYCVVDNIQNMDDDICAALTDLVRVVLDK